jgi:DNA polymerase III subunit gamma/tau
VVSYLVLARKYRPQTFEDLAGQDHVARTLANAIAGGRIAHAFLFTGVRGVGKTTSARLLAKCLNCVGPDGKLTGPTATPCNECAPCREITAGQDLDVQEIDGASYNGVDEVRRLQEGMSFRPARDRFKVYIVDEVHMLSTAAWNAFLKTLEEPPPHVKFIFATTEVHKVPITILSRCQRYDFKLISTQTIARRLEQVLVQENIKADAPAVQILAREAAGSMRDAMSLLDQVIAFSGLELKGDDVTRVLGVADRKILHELASALVAGDAAACLGVVERLAQQGFDLPHVARDVLQHLRNLVVAKVCAGPQGARGEGATAASAAQSGPSLRELLDLADEEIGEVVELAARADSDDLSRLFQGFSRAFDEVVRSSQPRTALEMALVRLARRPPLLPLDELLARVGDLERRLGGAPPPGPATRGGGGGGAGRSAQALPASIHAPTGGTRTHGSLALVDPLPAVAEMQQVSAQPAPRAPPPAPSPTAVAPGPPSQVPPQAATITRSAAQAAAQVPWSPPQAVAQVRRSLPAAPAQSPWSPPQAPSQVPRSPPQAASQVPRSPPQAPSQAVAGPPQTPSPAVLADRAAWHAVITLLREAQAPVASFFEYALPLEMTASRVVIGFELSAAFQAARAGEPEALEALTQAVRAHFGAPTQVVLEVASKGAPGVRTVASLDAERRSAELAAARAAVEAHPVVQEAMRVFGASLSDVKLPGVDG